MQFISSCLVIKKHVQPYWRISDLGLSIPKRSFPEDFCLLRNQSNLCDFFLEVKERRHSVAWQGSADPLQLTCLTACAGSLIRPYLLPHAVMSCQHFQESLDRWWARCWREGRRWALSRDPVVYHLGLQVLLGSANIVLINALTTALLIKSISHLRLL